MKAKVMVILNGFARTVARFRANSDRANLNCNENPDNSKSYQDEIGSLGITQVHRTYLCNRTKGRVYFAIYLVLIAIPNMAIVNVMVIIDNNYCCCDEDLQKTL